MTAIRGAARAINPLLIRPQPQPQPQPSDTSKGENAPAAKVGPNPPEGDVAIKRFRTGSVRASQTPKADPPASPPLSGDAPNPPVDIEIQKALETAMKEFKESGGGSIAELGKALYESVWNTLEAAGETNTPVKSAMAVTEYLNGLKDFEPEQPVDKNPVRIGSAKGVGFTPIADPGPSIGDINGAASGIASGGIDIRI